MPIPNPVPGVLLKQNAGRACQIARDEFTGANKRKTRQAKCTGQSNGALAKTARIVPSVMELRQQDVGCDVHRADPASRPEYPANAASQGSGIVPGHCRPVAAEEAYIASRERKQAAAEICKPSDLARVTRIHQRKITGRQAKIDRSRRRSARFMTRPGGRNVQDRDTRIHGIKRPG